MTIQNVSVADNVIYKIGMSGVLGDGIAVALVATNKIFSITGNTIRNMSAHGY